jgi:hypothetical protein
MNIFEMLELYLQEHDIRCHIPKNFTYKGPEGPDDKIKVHLKHMDLGETISLSISQIELTAKGTKIFGNDAHRHRYDRQEPEFIADLADPQAFDRIRLWIRQQETAMRHSATTQEVLGRLVQSPYARQCEMLDGNIETTTLQLDGEDLTELLEDLKPNLPPVKEPRNHMIEVEER